MMIRRTTLLSIAGLALVLGACGDDDDTSTPPDTSTETTLDGGGATEADMVEIKDFAFDPSEFSAAPGAEITFTNADETAHTATAKDQSLFDSTSIAPGTSATITVPSEPGTYEFFCAFHPTMVGAITVG